MIKRTITGLAVLGGLLGTTAAFTTSPAHAATMSTETVGVKVLAKAETKAGDWYDARAYYPTVSLDCSGLVYWSVRAAGYSWPSQLRTTYDILSYGVSHGYVTKVKYPQRGDLAFYGSGHVEFCTTWYHHTYGAHTTGQRIGWTPYFPGTSWNVTAFYRINK
jgi:cell wall-associated NlpC family hydrolase